MLPVCVQVGFLTLCKISPCHCPTIFGSAGQQKPKLTHSIVTQNRISQIEAFILYFLEEAKTVGKVCQWLEARGLVFLDQLEKYRHANVFSFFPRLSEMPEYLVVPRSSKSLSNPKVWTVWTTAWVTIINIVLLWLFSVDIRTVISYRVSLQAEICLLRCSAKETFLQLLPY